MPRAAGDRVWTRRRVFIEVLPFALIVLIVVGDLLGGPKEEIVPLLALGPAVVAVSRRALQTAFVGMLALIAGAALIPFDTVSGSRKVVGMLTIAGVTVAGVGASIIRERQQRELADVQAVVDVAERVLLRPLPERTGPLEIGVRYASASVAARIGGDLYSVISTAECVRFILGDVQGKGLTAVQTASVVLGAFREAAFDASDLLDIATRLESSLQRQPINDEFVTALIGQVVGGEPTVELVSCGHPPPLLIRNGVARSVEDLDTSLALGLAQFGPSTRKPMSLTLESGDQLLLYTDGVSEARDKTGAFYPLLSCGQLLYGDLEAALSRLQDDIIDYVGHALDDDAAILLIRPVVDPGQPESGGSCEQSR